MTERKSLSDSIETKSRADELVEALLPIPESHGQGDTSLAEAMLGQDPSLAKVDIITACMTGELETVRAIIEKDPSLATNEGGTRGWDPLLYLTFSKFLRTSPERAKKMVEIAWILLQNGADPNTCWIDPDEADGNRETPLYGAAGIANNVDLTAALISAGADPNDGETAYHMVEHDGVPCARIVWPLLKDLHRGAALGHKVDYDDIDGLRTLLELGVSPNGPTPFSIFPIHSAVWRDRSKAFFDLLIEYGADVNLEDKSGKTAYALAARAGRRQIMQWLLDVGASTDLAATDAFIAASAAGDGAEAKRMLGDDPELFRTLDDRDLSEICEAAAAGNTIGVATMIDVGWDVNTRGRIWGETPAHRAAMSGHLETVKLLVDKGADLSIRDRSYDAPPVGWAAHSGQTHIIEFLGQQ